MKHKAFKIDATARTITPVEIGELEDYYREIGCEMIECAVRLENGDSIFVDEEGLLRPEVTSHFQWDAAYFKGNAIVIGGDDETGETHDVQTTLEEIKDHVSFMPHRITITLTELSGTQISVEATGNGPLNPDTAIARALRQMLEALKDNGEMYDTRVNETGVDL